MTEGEGPELPIFQEEAEDTEKVGLPLIDEDGDEAEMTVATPANPDIFIAKKGGPLDPDDEMVADLSTQDRKTINKIARTVGARNDRNNPKT